MKQMRVGYQNVASSVAPQLAETHPQMHQWLRIEDSFCGHTYKQHNTDMYIIIAVPVFLS